MAHPLLMGLRKKWNSSSDRSRKAASQIVLSLCAKSVSVIVPLLIVPLTIDYINPTQYGIWLTLSSIIAWVSFLDLGLGNGFRNKFAEAKAKKNIEDAKKYVSTTYFAIGVIVFCAIVIITIINHFVDWAEILKVPYSYSSELHNVFAIVSVFFCLNLFFNVFTSLLAADQKPGISSVIHGVGQIMSLLVIWTLTKTTTGSLTNLALYFSGIPCLVLFLASIYAFRFTEYKEYIPKFCLIERRLIKNILSLGIKFFLIFLSSIVIFQIINIVISREIGPDAVTEYNVAYKYFAVIYSFMSIIIAPFWSAFTDAYYKKDEIWMRKTTNKLEHVWLIVVILGIIMLICSTWVYKLWIGDSVKVSFYLSLGVLFYILSQSLASIYMHIINGIGTIRLQVIVYCVYAILSWPLLTFFCRQFGVAGIIVVPTLVYLTQALIGRIQVVKLLKNRATGIWAK